MSDLTSLEEQWAMPSSIYRSAPFWSWNSELEPERLQAEVESMHGAGMGGFFMHSRYGLKTPYLSERWFECVSACVEKARELDMKACLYDEDRWPSGPAGGLVTREHPEYRLKYLSAGYDAPDPTTDKVHGVYDVELDAEGRLINYERLGGPGEIMTAEEAHPEHRALFFCPGYQEVSGWTNDGGYLDTLDPEAVAEFLRVTHQAYADRYEDDMGGIIPAIFTDEPSYGAQIYRLVDGRQRVPWTCELVDEFIERRGYDLRERLPELVLPPAEGDFSQVRYDYHRTITELFVEAFSQQIGEWCGEHDIALTGHMLAEQTLASQRRAVGAAMPHYEFMQWPGIDMLRDQMKELTTAKQCTSVADQLGAERVLSETYGCTGWDWPLEGHKFSGDWQWCCGVNYRCPHLTHYSLAGGAKRDYPASIRDHSPWWPHYNAVEDYFGRLSLMLTQGTPVRDVLVLHPVESGWGLIEVPGQERTIDRLEEQLEAIIYALMGQHYDFDFGDETILSRHAEVDGDALVVGQMRYRAVIVPPSITLRSSTVALLEELIDAGGTVIFAGDVPTRVDALPDDRAAELAGRATTCDPDPDAVIATLEAAVPRRVSILEDGEEMVDAWAMLREVEGGYLLFVDSHDRENPRVVTLSVVGSGQVVEWDLSTGERRIVPSEERERHVEIQIRLEPTGSALLSLGVDVPGTVHQPPEPEVVERDELSGPFAIERTEPNTMPLDYCQYRVADAQFSEPVPVLTGDAQIRATYGLGTRLGPEHQPWYLYTTGVVDTEPRDECQLRWTFHVTDVPSSCRFAVENPEDYAIEVNGTEVAEVDGWWVDEDIETLDISDHVREGENEIVLTFVYRPTMEIEPAYLLGDFGVATRDAAAPAPDTLTLVSPPEQLDLGSWVEQDLPTYGGAVRYLLTLDRPDDGCRCRVSLPDVECTAAVIHVGGEQFVLPWPPFAADITDAMSEGANEVAIEVIGGRKNILGPLHTPWEPWTGPNEFNPGNEKWRHDYYLTDHGLMGPVVVETLA